MSEGLFGIHGAALEIRAQRMNVLGSNIANAGTPGYKARDIDFGAALQARLAGNESGNAVDRATVYRIPTMASLDGNTVDMDRERAAFTDNSVRYQAALTILNSRIQGLKQAMQPDQ